MIGESIAICRYIEELHPEPNLFGATPLERAMVEMWQRRVEWHLLLPIAQAFRHSHPHMSKMEDPQVSDWAAANRTRALRNMMIFDEVLRDRPFVAGERFTVADITGLVALDFARPARIAIPPELTHLTRWHESAEGAAERGGVTGSGADGRPRASGGLHRQTRASASRQARSAGP